MARKGLTVHITGDKRTLLHLDRIRANLPKMGQNVIRFMATKIKNQAQANVRARAKYDTIDYMQNISRKDHQPGQLAESINILTLNNSENGNKAEVGVEPSSGAIGYAGIVELGRAGGTKIRPRKKGMRRKLKFASNKYGGIGYPREVTQGKQRGMFYTRDAVLQTAKVIRGKLQIESDMLLAK